MKGTIYGSRLLRGKQVEKGWESLIYGINRLMTVIYRNREALYFRKLHLRQG